MLFYLFTPLCQYRLCLSQLPTLETIGYSIGNNYLECLNMQYAICKDKSCNEDKIPIINFILSRYECRDLLRETLIQY